MKEILTERQKEVLLLMSKGFTNPQIADKLVITIHTVKAHICEIFEKLKVETRLQAAITAIKKGIISIDDV